MIENPFHIQSIHHGAFATSRLEETIRFWRDLLGFKLIISLTHDEERQYFFGLPNGPTLTFFEWPKATLPPRKRHGAAPAKGKVGFDHVAFQVLSLDDLSALQNLFVDHDFAASEIIDHGFLYSLYSFDPNNIAIEFVVIKEGVDLYQNPLLKDHSPPQIVDQSPAITPRYEPDPEEERIVVDGEGSQYFKKSQ